MGHPHCSTRRPLRPANVFVTKRRNISLTSVFSSQSYTETEDMHRVPRIDWQQRRSLIAWPRRTPVEIAYSPTF
jgi:hypothetical protein